MIIGACGFTGTGSSAVVDYLKGFDSVCIIDKGEFILAHSPDGLEDLDYQLNKHCCKYSSSEVALKRFRLNVRNYTAYRFAHNTEEKDRIMKLTDEYIDSIVQACWIGNGSADFQLHTSKLSRKAFDFSRRVFIKIPYGLKKNWKHYPLYKMEFSMEPEGFYEKTKEYVNSILEIGGADLDKKIILDQPFSATKPELAFPYFEDPLAIVVDRDPRDLYTIVKKIYLKSWGFSQVPTDDVKQFVVFYRKMREIDRNISAEDEKRILNIRFEDMIYNYEETSKIINAFCGLDEKDKKKMIFDPKVSIKNTQVYKNYPELADDIKYIEQMLPNYLFDFESYNKTEI